MLSYFRRLALWLLVVAAGCLLLVLVIGIDVFLASLVEGYWQRVGIFMALLVAELAVVLAIEIDDETDEDVRG